jgi:hypothetical protein
MSRGVIDSRDLLYFIGLTVLLLLFSRQQIQKR